MKNAETAKYVKLNELAAQGGVAILGGSADREIPLCELKQAFGLEAMLYNRSVDAISVNNAVEIYDACVAPLAPETVLLHIGDADIRLFADDSSRFDQKYRELVKHIRDNDSKCGIVIVSLANPDGSADVAELNRHLKYIAESERCQYGDIAAKKVWNPRETRGVMTFLNAMGFGGARHQPIYDLIRILFCSCAAKTV